MLFKEKLLLSNCDSVKGFSTDQLKKRFLTGMAFGDGVVLSPNMLIDNVGFDSLLGRRNVVKYLNEEGHGKLVLRGLSLTEGMSLMDYYEALPGSFIFSSVDGKPTKASLNKSQERELVQRIQTTHLALEQLGYVFEKLDLTKDSLSNEIKERLDDEDCLGLFFEDDGERGQFLALAKDKVSRSDWYGFADAYFDNDSGLLSEQFKAEVVDPAYNSLFAMTGEGFLQDNIKYISGVPEILLDASVSYKALRNELQLFEYSFKAFEIISTFGTTELYKFLTDQALDFIEGKVSDQGKDYFSRKNWFGMYNKLRTTIGLEIK